MKMMNTKKIKKLLLTTLSGLILVGCSGGGGGTSLGNGSFYNPSESVDQFVSALNSVDLTIFDPSTVLLYENQTLRSAVAGQEQWFVIFDSKYNEYKAVSLQYVRSIVYYDFYANSTALANEFRNIESTDIFNGDINGDYFGDNYEVVDAVAGGLYQGRNSGMLYDDEEDTEDVILEMQDSELKKFALSASKISYMYKVSLPTAMSIYTLGQKSKSLLKKGELTQDDQLSLAKDLEKITGSSAEDVVAALTNKQKKEALLKNVAKKLGTTQDSLENRILPDFFGLKI